MKKSDRLGNRQPVQTSSPSPKSLKCSRRSRIGLDGVWSVMNPYHLCTWNFQFSAPHNIFTRFSGLPWVLRRHLTSSHSSQPYTSPSPRPPSSPGSTGSEATSTPPGRKGKILASEFLHGTHSLLLAEI